MSCVHLFTLGKVCPLSYKVTLPIPNCLLLKILSHCLMAWFLSPYEPLHQEVIPIKLKTAEVPAPFYSSLLLEILLFAEEPLRSW